jgi:small-conductance mechanosensitive channel
MLNAGKVINRSAPQRRMRIKVPIGIAYGSDIDKFVGLMLDVVEKEDLVLENPHPRIRFRKFGDSALEYELLCWVANPTHEGKVIHRLNRAIYHRLSESGIEIPFPQRRVTLVQEDRASDRPPAVAPDTD